jgi:hypothetical protein
VQNRDGSANFIDACTNCSANVLDARTIGRVDACTNGVAGPDGGTNPRRVQCN